MKPKPVPKDMSWKDSIASVTLQVRKIADKDEVDMPGSVYFLTFVYTSRLSWKGRSLLAAFH